MFSHIGRTALTCSMLVALAGTARAELPPVIDRVPDNAAMVIGIRNMERIDQRFTELAGMLNAPMDGAGEDSPFEISKAVMSLEGINKSGSFAVFMMPGADGTVAMDETGEGQDDSMILLVPVTDFAAFVKGIGGTGAEGIVEVTFDEEPAFTKDIGNGYAAMSPSRELLTAYDAKAGKLAAHTAALGKSGQKVVDQADAFLFASIKAFKPQLEQAAAGFAEQGEMIGMMAGPQGQAVEPVIKAGQALMKRMIEDGSVGVAGMGISEKGVWFDMGIQFREGTDSAQRFNGAGSEASLLSRLPNTPFLFAAAIDLSSSGMKQLFRDMGTMREKDSQGTSMTALIGAIDTVNSYAISVGANPGGMMAGLLANTSGYVATTDPAGFMKATREATKAMDGVAQEGMTMKVNYSPDAAEVAGVKIDSWTIQPQFDENDPNAMQMQMGMSMIFGPGGMGGMAGQVGNGVVTTMSQNTQLMTSAIESARDGRGLSEDALLKESRAGLFANPSFEMYLGTKSIADTVAGLMAMMGGGAEFDVPAQVSPVAMGGLTDGGGMAFRVYVPNDVMKMLADISAAMDQGEGDMDAPMDDGGGDAPRF